MKRKLLTLMLIMSIAVANVGCGSQEGSDANTSTPVATEAPATTETPATTEAPEVTETPSNDVSTYADAATAFNAVWEKFDEDFMFPCFGGSIEAPVDNAAGKIDSSDVNTMTSTLLIPEDVQAVVTDAASLMHMMNANTFTGAAIKVDGMELADVANKIKDSFLGTHFMCGMPDKIVIGTLDGYVVYAFGSEDLINHFAGKLGSLEGGSVSIDQVFELDF